MFNKEGDSASDNPSPWSGVPPSGVQYSVVVVQHACSGSRDALPGSDPYICIEKDKKRPDCSSSSAAQHRPYLSSNVLVASSSPNIYPLCTMACPAHITCATLLASLSWFAHNHPQKKNPDKVDIEQKQINDGQL